MDMKFALAAAAAAIALSAGCGTAASPTGPAPASTAPKLFVVADNAVVYERTTAYTGGGLHVFISTGTGVDRRTVFSPSLKRVDDRRWTMQMSPSGTFVFEVGVEYRIQVTDSSRTMMFQNPDYGDEFTINGQRLRVSQITDPFLFISSYCRAFKFTSVSGTIE